MNDPTYPSGTDNAIATAYAVLENLRIFIVLRSLTPMRFGYTAGSISS